MRVSAIFRVAGLLVFSSFQAPRKFLQTEPDSRFTIPFCVGISRFSVGKLGNRLDLPTCFTFFGLFSRFLPVFLPSQMLRCRPGHSFRVPRVSVLGSEFSDILKESTVEIVPIRFPFSSHSLLVEITGYWSYVIVVFFLLD